MSEYTDALEAKLQASRNRVKQGREMKALKSSAPTLFEIMDGELSLLASRVLADVPLGRDEYLAAFGEAKGIRRIRDLIDSKEVHEATAAQEVDVITEQLNQFQDDKKQK